MAEMVHHPEHYNQHPSGIECIEIVQEFNFNIGNAIKYLWRAGLKPGTNALQDLAKAETYVRFERERLGEPKVEDVIERLREERNTFRADAIKVTEMWGEMKAERDALRKELEELQAKWEQVREVDKVHAEDEAKQPALWNPRFKNSWYGAPSPNVRWWAVDANGKPVWYEGEKPPIAWEKEGVWVSNGTRESIPHPIDHLMWRFENDTDWRTTLRRVPDDEVHTVGVLNRKHPRPEPKVSDL